MPEDLDDTTPDPVAELSDYVGAGAADEEFVAQCVAEATVLVDAHIGSAAVPVEVRRRAVKEAGSELFHRRQAPNGISQFATADGASPVRVARDPMLGAYPLLAPFVGMGFG